jgi:Putative transposase of IS4/5 family (DUF4096)
VGGGVSRWVTTNDLVSDDLWAAIQPLLPPEPCTTHGGPPCVSQRAALAGILYALCLGLRWRAGGLAPVAPGRPELLGDLGVIDWSRASLDSVSVRAKRGGEHTGQRARLQAAGATGRCGPADSPAHR